MADELSGAVRRALADAVRGVVGGRATVTRGTGTYVRTDADGTGWVLMAGADEPTPVNGRALIDAEPGDSVQWELDGTALSVTGNATTPAVGTRQVTREVAPVAARARDAYDEAVRARDAADAAEADAVRAHAAADNAANSARTANGAANSALTQLSIVEDVAGTLQWISDHGTFTATTDTTVQEGTVYFAYDGGDYVPIAEPTGDPSAQGWYVLDVSESQTDYIMSHIAVTSRGLWVLPSGIGSAADEQHAAGYKVLLSPTGMTVYDGTGAAVATYGGQGISFAQDRSFYVGDEDAYILFDGDGHITIGGAVTLGESKTLSEVLSELEADTSTDVVGRNLLRKTGSVTAADLARTRSSVPEAGVIRLNPTATGDALAKFKVDYLDFSEYGEGTYTVSFDAREVDDGSGLASGQPLRTYIGFSTAGRIGNTFGSSADRYTQKSVTLTDQWVRHSLTFSVPDDLRSGQATALVAGSQLSVQPFRYRGYLPAEVRRVKLERGLRATTWAPAMEDVDEGIGDAAKTATDYITDVTSDGIWVTPSDAKPVSGAAAATTSGWHIADALELFRQGASVFRVWVESAATKVRIGMASLPHVVIDSDGLHLMAIGSTVAYEIMSITHADGLVVRSEIYSSGHRTKIEPGAIHVLHGDGTGGEVDLGTASVQSSGADNVDVSSTAVHGLTTYSDAYDDLFVEIGSDADYVMTHDAKVLFEGSYASTRNAAITLPNPDKACLYFDRLLVEYEDAGGRRGSVWVRPSLGLTFGCQTIAANATTGVIVRSKTYEVGGQNGEVVDVANYTAGVPQYGRMNVSTSGAATWQSANEIGIVRIIGFR